MAPSRRRNSSDERGRDATRAVPPFRELVALELDPDTQPTVRHRRSGAISTAASDGAAITWLDRPDRDLVGLALSGGGIRSATFNLGLLQGLSDLRILDALDYLSTVSGGGYIGGFWSAWRARREGNGGNDERRTSDGASTDEARDPFTEPPQHGRAESDAVRHLREFSNFLNPRLGLLTYDTGRLVASVVSSTLPALAAAMSAIVLIYAGWQAVAYGILGLPAISRAGEVQSLLTMLAITAFVFASEERVWIRRGERWSWWYLLAGVIGVATLAALWQWWFLHVHRQLRGALVEGSESVVSNWTMLMLPAGAWLTSAVVMVVLRLFLARVGRPSLREARGALDRITIRFIALGGTWTVLAFLWVTSAVLLFRWLDSSGIRLTGFATVAAALGAAFGVVQRLMTKSAGKPFGGRIAVWIKPKLPQFIAYAAAIALVLTALAGLWWFNYTPMLDAEPWLPLHLGPVVIERAHLPYAAALLVTVVTLAVFDPNESGLHGFYRSRLARAYLGASNPEGRRQTEELRDDDLRLDRLSRRRPLHLVCCAANDLSPSSDHLGNLHRGAVSAVLSPVGFSVGSEWAAWPPDDSHVPTLAAAMTASGAAFNSQMGSKSMALGSAVTFLMAALNLRLGLWLPHPSKFAHKRYRLLPGRRFYEELLGQSRANANHVHLSDGGHFENMALYELIRRHCRYIIASDCGADADVAFDDLGNVVRRVREDFGVEIVIDLAPLRPNADGFARQAMVAGDIRYPNGDTGVLLVFKPAVTGTEPADIMQYRRRNGAFPHESTGDQFYDEAQWESYRRLGLHCARTAFRDVIATVGELRASDTQPVDRAARRWAARVFARARMQWQPLPPGLETRLARIVDRAGELDALLQETSCVQVLREVYKEIDELDRLAKQRAAAGGARADVEMGGTDRGAGGRTGATDAAGAADQVTPRAEDLAPSLHAIRRAILFMEEVYLSENLEHNASHPLYLGLTNYFARWAYAPLFRMWWPLLKSMYAHDFARFLERQFQLTSVTAPDDTEERVLTALTPENEGFAMHCWRLHGLPQPDPRNNELLLSFALAMRYQSTTAFSIQAAQLLMRRRESTAVWDAEHFFVPPGLWGIGIGGRFLSRITAGNGAAFGPGGPLEGIDRLLVRISAPRQASRAKAKEVADLVQLYRDAGFAEVSARRVDDAMVVIGEEHPPLAISLERTEAHEREWWFERRLHAGR